MWSNWWNKISKGIVFCSEFLGKKCKLGRKIKIKKKLLTYGVKQIMEQNFQGNWDGEETIGGRETEAGGGKGR